MGRFVRGDIVVVRFPFTDLSAEKRRPAVVLAALDHDDYLLCQVTSKPWHEPAIKIEADDLEEGSLPVTSFARPDRLFTAHHEIAEYRAGTLGKPKLEKILDAARTVLT